MSIFDVAVQFDCNLNEYLRHACSSDHPACYCEGNYRLMVGISHTTVLLLLILGLSHGVTDPDISLLLALGPSHGVTEPDISLLLCYRSVKIIVSCGS